MKKRIYVLTTLLVVLTSCYKEDTPNYIEVVDEKPSSNLIEDYQYAGVLNY